MDTEKQYLNLNVPTRNIKVSVKFDDEGVVVDVWDMDFDDDVLASTWELYTELPIEQKVGEGVVDEELKALEQSITEAKSLYNTIQKRYTKLTGKRYYI